LGARIGLRAEADFACDDHTAQLPFSEVVFGRDITIIGPMIHPVGLVVKDVLEPLNDGMTGGTFDDADDSLFGLFGSFVKFPIADGKASQTHSLGQKRGKGTHKGIDFLVVGEFLL